MRGGDGAQGGRGIGGSEEASMAMGTEGDAACKAASGRQDGGLRDWSVTRGRRTQGVMRGRG